MTRKAIAIPHLLSRRKELIPEEIYTVATADDDDSSFTRSRRSKKKSRQRKGRMISFAIAWYRIQRLRNKPLKEESSQKGNKRKPSLTTTTDSKIAYDVEKQMDHYASDFDLRSRTAAEINSLIIWCSTILFQIYMIIAITLVSGDAMWLLKGLSFLLLVKMLEILSKWNTYFRKGPAYMR